MYGVGEDPIIYKEVNQSQAVSSSRRISTEEQDIEFMTQLHKDVVTSYIDDDSMAPLYTVGVMSWGIRSKEEIWFCPIRFVSYKHLTDEKW